MRHYQYIKLNLETKITYIREYIYIIIVWLNNANELFTEFSKKHIFFIYLNFVIYTF